MFPVHLPDEVRQNPKREAECRVYDCLKEQLKDLKFDVYYSKDWLNQKLTKLGREDGECDFIIAHPDLGILFVEVKGGKITKEGSSDKWYSGQNEIKNPVRQARTSKHVIREAMSEQWREGIMPFIKMVHCVLLPDSSRNKTYLGEGMPVELFGFMDDMESLSKKIYDFYDFEAANDCRINGTLGQKGVDILRRMFAMDLDFTPRLVHKLKRQNYLIEEETDAQREILRAAKSFDRLLVEGPAGSGKTMIAIGLALDEISNIDGDKKNILITCLNVPLCKFIKDFLPKDKTNIWVNTFHSLCRKLVLDAGILRAEEINKNINAFNRNILNYAWEAVDRLGAIFDIIIIDEGQDFSEDWWEFLQVLIKDNPESKFRVFRDNNQRLYTGSPAKYAALEGPLYLDKIVRNTRQIGGSTLAYYSGENVRLGGPEGDDIKWVVSENELLSVSKLIKRIVVFDEVSLKDIAILTNTPIDKTVFSSTDDVAGYPIVQCDGNKEGITVDTIKRFKGLEKDVIILCSFSRLPTDEELYVGMSRAKSYLAIVSSESIIKHITDTIESSIHLI